jgi:hypothetical protein
MSNDKSRIEPVSEASDEGVVYQDPREELLFRAAHFRWWENEAQTPVLLTYYCYAKALRDFLRTGTIAEAAALARTSKASIKRAKALGAHPFEWFHEKWIFRSEAGDRLTRRDIESLAVTTLSQERAVLAAAKAHVGGSRKIEEATRRKKVPQRDSCTHEEHEPSTEGPASGIFPSRSKDLAKTRPRKIDDASREEKKSSTK